MHHTYVHIYTYIHIYIIYIMCKLYFTYECNIPLVPVAVLWLLSLPPSPTAWGPSTSNDPELGTFPWLYTDIAQQQENTPPAQNICNRLLFDNRGRCRFLQISACVLFVFISIPTVTTRAFHLHVCVHVVIPLCFLLAFGGRELCPTPPCASRVPWRSYDQILPMNPRY